MNREKLTNKITEILFELICEGGGDGETLREYAEIIAELMEKNDD